MFHFGASASGSTSESGRLDLSAMDTLDDDDGVVGGALTNTPRAGAGAGARTGIYMTTATDSPSLTPTPPPSPVSAHAPGAGPTLGVRDGSIEDLLKAPQPSSNTNFLRGLKCVPTHPPPPAAPVCIGHSGGPRAKQLFVH